MLLNFEQYLYTVCGPLSAQNLAYLLWRGIMKYHMTTHPQRKELLAVKIHQTFIFEQSVKSVTLPEALKEKIDPREKVQRPDEQVLLTLQKMAEEVLDIAVKKYMYSEEDSLTSLPSLGRNKHSRTVSRNSKVRTVRV